MYHNYKILRCFFLSFLTSATRGHQIVVYHRIIILICKLHFGTRFSKAPADFVPRFSVPRPRSRARSTSSEGGRIKSSPRPDTSFFTCSAPCNRLFQGSHFCLHPVFPQHIILRRSIASKKHPRIQRICVRNHPFKLLPGFKEIIHPPSPARAAHALYRKWKARIFRFSTVDPNCSFSGPRRSRNYD